MHVLCLNLAGSASAALQAQQAALLARSHMEAQLLQSQQQLDRAHAQAQAQQREVVELRQQLMEATQVRPSLGSPLCLVYTCAVTAKKADAAAGGGRAEAAADGGNAGRGERALIWKMSTCG